MADRLNPLILATPMVRPSEARLRLNLLDARALATPGGAEGDMTTRGSGSGRHLRTSSGRGMGRRRACPTSTLSKVGKRLLTRGEHMSTSNHVIDLLGKQADSLLSYKAKGFGKEALHLPGADFVDRIVVASDRPPRVLRSFQALLDHGRLAGTGYVSILPVDQGIEHSAGASFAKNPIYFDGENLVKLAIEGGCNAVASTLGVLGSVALAFL